MNDSRLIVLIGTSSAGKSSTAKQLQLLLPKPYLLVGLAEADGFFSRGLGSASLPGEAVG